MCLPLPVYCGHESWHPLSQVSYFHLYLHPVRMYSLLHGRRHRRLGPILSSMNMHSQSNHRCEQNRHLQRTKAMDRRRINSLVVLTYLPWHCNPSYHHKLPPSDLSSAAPPHLLAVLSFHPETYSYHPRANSLLLP